MVVEKHVHWSQVNLCETSSSPFTSYVTAGHMDRSLLTLVLSSVNI